MTVDQVTVAVSPAVRVVTVVGLVVAIVGLLPPVAVLGLSVVVIGHMTRIASSRWVSGWVSARYVVVLAGAFAIDQLRVEGWAVGAVCAAVGVAVGLCSAMSRAWINRIVVGAGLLAGATELVAAGCVGISPLEMATSAPVDTLAMVALAVTLVTLVAVVELATVHAGRVGATCHRWQLAGTLVVVLSGVAVVWPGPVLVPPAAVVVGLAVTTVLLIRGQDWVLTVAASMVWLLAVAGAGYLLVHAGTVGCHGAANRTAFLVAGGLAIRASARFHKA